MFPALGFVRLVCLCVFDCEDGDYVGLEYLWLWFFVVLGFHLGCWDAYF